MKIYKSEEGIIVEREGEYFLLKDDWDRLTNIESLYTVLLDKINDKTPLVKEETLHILQSILLPPIGSQEVWAAGVTYLQSRNARMEEAKAAGGGDFYDKVYEAERPELFFKALPHRVAGPGQAIYIREDSTWNVPEPELTIFINSSGNINGYTIGNDMSSRSIEGENPLYLPQAKVYERSAALGPCLYVPEKPIPEETVITMTIYRNEEVRFTGSIQLNQMKRTLKELAVYLYKGFHFPHGSYLMTGTCLVPKNEFTLKPADRVEISIEHIGTLVNTVATFKK